MMTSERCPNGWQTASSSCFLLSRKEGPQLSSRNISAVAGTERCYEALKKLHTTYDLVVNIQGDEPLIDPDIIDGVVKALQVGVLRL